MPKSMPWNILYTKLFVNLFLLFEKYIIMVAISIYFNSPVISMVYLYFCIQYLLKTML